LNPLHVDPTLKSGFDRPILHGLCTFGIAARSLLDNEFIDSPMRLREMGTRFTGHVFPGETLIMEAWREPD
jgi:acyl dehydratase